MRCIAFSSVAAMALASAMTIASFMAMDGPAQAQGLRNDTGSSGVGGRASYNVPPPVHATRERNLGGGFIEMLITGRDPSPRVRAVRPDTRMVAPQARATRPGQRVVRVEPAPVRAAAPRSQAVMQDLSGPPRVIRAEIPTLGSASASHNRQVASLQQPVPQQRRSVAAGHAIAPEYRRQVVNYNGRHAPGTVVVDTGNRFLYLVQSDGTAIRYGVGVGRQGFSWKGTQTVSRKAEWPSWRPPEAMLRRQPDLPRYMAGGPDNPLGARALYLGSTLYRIHGTNEPHTIGQAMSSGCVRMLNEDVMDLYERVRVGAKVVVM
jgi:lipoprotein-anchoring transpeptidase ErfK/SrfK